MASKGNSHDDREKEEDTAMPDHEEGPEFSDGHAKHMSERCEDEPQEMGYHAAYRPKALSRSGTVRSKLSYSLCNASNNLGKANSTKKSLKKGSGNIANDEADLGEPVTDRVDEPHRKLEHHGSFPIDEAHQVCPGR
jgi:hypothetical protein